MSERSARADLVNTDWENRSRPSKNNPSEGKSGPNEPESGPALDRRKWWHRKNDRVDEWIEEAPGRAARLVSVVGSTTLREEASAEKVAGEQEYRSRPWSAVLREFLGWYNGYRFSHLRFRAPNGEIVRSPMKNSYQPAYGDKYYAKIKAVERQALKRYDDPHVVMLTLTASTKNAHGGWRCPADHLRDVVDPFTDHVRPALHRALGSNGADVAEWEYVRILEHHKSGYGHMHVAVFVDGEVDESDFHAAIDAHIRHCEPAHRDAHDYYHPDPERRPISVRRIDPGADPDRDELEAVSNLGSYIAEYIGTYGEELFERPIEQLAFFALTWGAPTRRVDFSNGAEEYIEAELGPQGGSDGERMRATWKDGVTAEDIERAATEDGEKVSDLVDVDGDGWDLEGIGVVDEDGEEFHEAKHSGVQYVEIEDASHLDPPKQNPPDAPVPRYENSSVGDFG